MGDHSKSLSWGRYFDTTHQFLTPYWRDEVGLCLQQARGQGILAHGAGRSYGDSCLNSGKTLVMTQHLDRFLQFDPQKGTIRVEAGVTIGQLLQFLAPRGYFLPVVCGTQFVTIGGAVAHDIHGKNHHQMGSIGRHLLNLTLLTSDGTIHQLSPGEERFKATVAGLGLTGFILDVEIQLIPGTAFVKAETVPFASLEEFFDLSDVSEAEFQYTAGWLDCVSQGRAFSRGVFFRGNHGYRQTQCQTAAHTLFTVPFEMPGFFLSKKSIQWFNSLYSLKNNRKTQKIQFYQPFFFPLDRIKDWNLIYGKNGLLQYQCVVPLDQKQALQQILKKIVGSGMGSFLAVIKKFGNLASPGLLSFPMQGYTLALDFKNQGANTIDLLRSMDQMVLTAGGRVYPAKDACMEPATFQRMYPACREFMQFKDPEFSSSFWRRVMEE